MALVGITLDRQNPKYTYKDFLFWCPQFTNYIETEQGQTAFDNLYEIANAKVFYSIYGSDWRLAMSYCIAHYLTIIGNQLTTPAGSTLESIAGGGVVKGILQSASVGGFSKSYNFQNTLVAEEEALWWNQTSYGAALMALLKTKAVPSIMVITSGPIPPKRR